MSVKIVTTIVSAGTKGAETRHHRIVEILRRHGFRVGVQILNSRVQRKLIPSVARKLGAGFLTACRSVCSGDTYFAFDPYVFVGGALAARAKGAQALYFCRNDQVYQQREILQHKGRRGHASIHLYLLQFACLVLCSRYVVQTDFAKQRLIRRFRWSFGLDMERKIEVLNNDLHIPLAPPLKPQHEDVLRVAFVSNPAWDKKGFPIIEKLVKDPAFLGAPIELQLIGEGKAFDKIVAATELATSSGQLTHIGYIDGPEMIPQLADVVLVPSVVDHFPNLLIECAALGVPMILSDIEAHRYVFPEHRAYFSLSASPVEIVELMMELLDNPQERFRIAQQQQMSIVRLKDAWSQPLCYLFKSD